VLLVPPGDIALPAIPIVAGVIDDHALAEAGWASARLGRILEVRGASLRQRVTVADGIVARGGRAEPGRAGGRLRLVWSSDQETPDSGSGQRRP
jgi:hypothetical protein